MPLISDNRSGLGAAVRRLTHRMSAVAQTGRRGAPDRQTDLACVRTKQRAWRVPADCSANRRASSAPDCTPVVCPLRPSSSSLRRLFSLRLSQVADPGGCSVRRAAPVEPATFSGWLPAPLGRATRALGARSPSSNHWLAARERTSARKMALWEAPRSMIVSPELRAHERRPQNRYGWSWPTK